MQDINDKAKSEGWKLITTINNGTSKPFWDVAGINITDRSALQHVVLKAKTGSKLHLEAMRLVMQSRGEPSPTRNKR